MNWCSMTFLFHLSSWVLKGYNKHKKHRSSFIRSTALKLQIHTHPPKCARHVHVFFPYNWYMYLEYAYLKWIPVINKNSIILNSFFSIICMLFKMKYIDKSHCHRRSNSPPICRLYLPTIVYASLNQRIPVTADDSR